MTVSTCWSPLKSARTGFFVRSPMRLYLAAMIAQTPPTPYYAVIFTSVRTNETDGYGDTAVRMVELAHDQPGFLGVESAREQVGITVSYWESLEAIRDWKRHAEHAIAQQTGRERWYETYKVRICKVERDYEFERD
jgi:heme-degrading monooxygenase HmoA